MPKKLLMLAGAALAVAVALPIVAQAKVVQTFKISVPPARAGGPIALNVDETTADDTGVQPSPLKQQTIRFQKGGVFNGKYFKRCKRSTLVNTTKCSSSSRIGSGDATAVAEPIVPLVQAPLTLYNGERQGGVDTVYIYAVPDIGPNLLTVGTVKRTSGKFGHELDFKIDDIQTLPGAPNASITSVSTRTPVKHVKRKVRKRGRRVTVRTPYIQAPSKCSKTWAGQAQFRYADGQQLTIDGTIGCKKR